MPCPCFFLVLLGTNFLIDFDFVMLLLVLNVEILNFCQSQSKWCRAAELRLFQAIRFDFERQSLTSRPLHISLMSCRGATCTECAPKPDKTPIMVVRLRGPRRILFFKIKVRPRSCRPYPLWRPCVVRSFKSVVSFELHRPHCNP